MRPDGHIALALAIAFLCAAVVGVLAIFRLYFDNDQP